MKYKPYFLSFASCVIVTSFTYGQQDFSQLSYPILQKKMETLHKFGITLKDEYANLNNLEDPKIVQWFEAQDSVAEAYFSTNDVLKDYLIRFGEYESRENSKIRMIEINEKGNYFYLKYDDFDEIEKLYFRENLTSKEEMILDPSNYDEITEINYLKPSFDGKKIAIGYRSAENFSSIVRILNTATKRFYNEKITNINPSFGGIEWLPDSSGFIYLYFPVVDQKRSDYKKNSFSVLHKLGDSPNLKIKIFGKTQKVHIPSEFYPKVKIGSSKNEYIIGYSANANDFYDAYVAKVSDVILGKADWTPFFKAAHKVYTTEGEVRGDEFIYRQGSNPGNQISRIKICSPNFNNSELLIEGTDENPITQLKVTKNEVYYARSKFGAQVSLWKIDKTKNIIELKAPFVPGYVTFFGGSVRNNLIGVELDGWTSNYTRFLITENNKFQKEGLKTETLYPEFENIISEQIMIKSHDGIDVPLSLVYDPESIKDSDNEVFIYVYGAYGESLSPFFYPIFLDWAARGGILAFPHVRGGGEKGKAWHLQGQKMLKYNSWKDLIASAEALIEKGFTKKGLLSLYTVSAGGITAGMAVNESPDLFSSFIAEVPRLNPLGLESSKNVSSTSYMEYGSVKDSSEFSGLVKMDPYYNLESTKEYPPTLIFSASKDDRIPLWDSGKYIAKLQSISKNETPFLLDIDYHSGHEDLGNDNTIKLYSKIFTFAKRNMVRN